MIQLLVFAADELTMQVGQVFAGLVDITLAERMFAGGYIIAISKEDFVIVQSSCATQMDSSLITIGVITILVPTFLPSSVTATDPNSEQDVKVGRGVSIVSFTIYLAYLFFRLWSHEKIYAATSGESTSDNSHTANSNTITTTIDGSGNKEKAVPRLNACMALVLLVLAAALLAFTAEWLVVSIDGLTGSSNISKSF
ncbi:hypothetical protein C8R43DRAFT_964372 [Mycena crocata]|nr:hypothetical protein C8R43DRAFT_964372 [Mycena crocata]